MEKTLRSIETEDLKTLLQRYRMILNEETKELFCEIHKNYEHKYDANKSYCIRNHWEIHHGPKSMMYNDIKPKYRSINNLLLHYEITNGTLANCSECEYSENLEKDNELYYDNFTIMRDHWNQYRRYKTNIF